MVNNNFCSFYSPPNIHKIPRKGNIFFANMQINVRIIIGASKKIANS